jgi:hypothetical protein
VIENVIVLILFNGCVLTLDMGKRMSGLGPFSDLKTLNFSVSKYEDIPMQFSDQYLSCSLMGRDTMLECAYSGMDGQSWSEKALPANHFFNTP